MPLSAFGRGRSRPARQQTPRRPFRLQLVRGRPSPPVELLSSGAKAFARVIEMVNAAQVSIEIRAFVWRDDDTGNELARALLRAADRGVRVQIRKDRIGANYEYIAGSQQSFFHKHVGVSQRVRTWFLSTVYGKSGGGATQCPNPLALRLAQHANVLIERRKLFDHAKLFIFDDRRILMGSMGVGDNHRHDWNDVMVEIEGESLVRRLRQRLAGFPFDPDRQVDFLVHNRRSQAPGTCLLAADRLDLIDEAKHTLTVEMAYLGDPRFTDAMARAVRRGVDVTLVTAARADLLGDLNLASCDRLLRQTGAPSNLRIALHPQMIHTKIMVIDSRFCDIGSANFTRISHGVYDEVNLFINDRPFAQQLEQLVDKRCTEAQLAGRRIRFRKIRSAGERAFIAVFARNSAS